MLPTIEVKMQRDQLRRLAGRAMNVASSVLVFTSLALSGCTPPPSQEIRWTFGGNGDEHAIAARETSGGGYVIAGSTGIGDEGIHDIAVIKIDSTGQQVWGRTLGDDGYDGVVSLLGISNDHFAIVGVTEVPNETPDPYDDESRAYVVCFDGNGATTWERTFGTESPRAAALMEGGDIVVGGMSSSRTLDGMYLSRISSDGDLVWIKAVGGEDADLSALRVTSDGEIILAGSQGLGEESGGYLAKADGDGNLLWERSNLDDRVDYFPDLIETSQGDLVLLGRSFDLVLASAILVKTDSSGNALWTKAPSEEFANRYAGTVDAGSIVEASDGGYVLAGKFDQLLPSPDLEQSFGGMYLTKTDSQGNAQWSRVYAKKGHSPHANFVDVTTDGGFIVAGSDGGVLDETGVDFDNYDMAIVKTDANGDIETTK